MASTSTGMSLVSLAKASLAFMLQLTFDIARTQCNTRIVFVPKVG